MYYINNVASEETMMNVTEIGIITALLSDDRFESKDWKHADAVGRIEWLIAMLESKNEEIDMWVDMINGEAN